MSNIDTFKNGNTKDLQPEKISKSTSPVDELTGLNSKLETKRLVEEYFKITSVESPYALLILDVINFHSVNEKYGHMFGDNVLIQVADSIIENINTGDISGRLGGDEFVIFLKNVSHGAVAAMCDKIRRAVTGIYIGDGASVDVAIGAVTAKSRSASYDDLLQTADDALISASALRNSKIKITNKIVNFKKELSVSAIYDRSYVNALNSREKRLSELIFELLEEAKDIEKAILAVLALVGEKKSLTRITVYEKNGNELISSYVWVKRGYIAPESVDSEVVLAYHDKMDGASIEPHMGIIDETMLNGYAESEKSKLLVGGAKSVIYCDMLEFGEISGLMSYVDEASERDWNDKDFKAFKTITRLISAFTLKSKAIKNQK